MIRDLLMALLFAGALVVEEVVKTLPVVGVLSPDCGLLFMTLYALKARCERFWIVSFWAGLLKGSLVPIPCGFFILFYLLIVWIVLQIRGLLYVESPSTQVIVLFLAGSLQALLCALFVGTGLILDGDWIECLRILGSGATAALLAPAAVKIYVRSRFIRTLLGT